MSLDFKVWDAAKPADKEAWLARWKDWPDREVFAHPDYVALYAGRNGRALCATASCNGSHVLYPFLLRSFVDEPFCPPRLRLAADLASPYGYGGPFRCGAEWEPSGVNQFWSEFDRWAAAQAAISEVVRLALFPDTLLQYAGDCRVLFQNVVRTIDSEDELWRDFEYKVRKNVNRARGSGIVVEADDQARRFDDFLTIYNATMQRRNAKEAYYFPREYFERIHANLSGHYIYFHALLDGVVVSTELVLVSATRIYSFLGGTDAARFHLRPNDLLKVEIMNWARAAGKRQFVLGGGYVPGDGIYRYKLSFAPNGGVPFQLGSRILNQAVYDEMIEARRSFEESYGVRWTSDSSFFPAYRG